MRIIHARGRKADAWKRDCRCAAPVNAEKCRKAPFELMLNEAAQTATSLRQLQLSAITTEHRGNSPRRERRLTNFVASATAQIESPSTSTYGTTACTFDSSVADSVFSALWVIPSALIMQMGLWCVYSCSTCVWPTQSLMACFVDGKSHLRNNSGSELRFFRALLKIIDWIGDPVM
jgi:hypothetical protein